MILLFYPFGNNKIDCLIPGGLFQPIQMFVGKAKSYPTKAPFRCSTLMVFSWTNSQTLD